MHATEKDPGLIPLIRTHGIPQSRRSPPGFETLAKIINAQQLSTTAAAAIWLKFEKDCRGQVTPRKILNRSQSQLRELGVSRRKAEYLTGLAQMVVSNDLRTDDLNAQTDEDVINNLTKIRGMGIWSAEIYCLFALGRRDIYPAGDLALQIAIQWYAKLENRPSEAETRLFSQRWSPHRSAVALLMWKYYGAATLG